MIDECWGFFDMFGFLLFGQMDKYVLFGMKDAMLYAQMYASVYV